MKKIATALSIVALAAATGSSFAQSTDTTNQDKSARPSGKDAMESQMNLQKNKPSKAVTDAEKAQAKNRPGGKAGMEAQMNLQKNKPSKTITAEEKAKAKNRPNASKMTPEERAEFRKDVVKEAKP